MNRYWFYIVSELGGRPAGPVKPFSIPSLQSKDLLCAETAATVTALSSSPLVCWTTSVLQVPMEIFQSLFLNLLLAWMMMMILPNSGADLWSDALLSFKSELVDDANSLGDWFVPSGDVPSGKIYACSWSGVRCNKNSTSVVGLNLSGKNLGGEMSGKQLSIFTELVDLNLSQNSFSGKLPEEISNLTGLRSLDISKNNFAGPFLEGISSLKDLIVLDAFSNSFSGPLPVKVSELEHLKILNLAGSYFTGPIPPEFDNFKSLEFLHLAGNSITGHIPPELGKLQTLIHMEIGYNTYQGSIPWQLGNMSELQYLDIAGANLSGSIPKELSNLTKLESLFLFRNKLAGMIPWEFSRMKALRSLDLSDNQISGPIPESFTELKSLRLLSLMYNDMSGTVPEGIAELPSLENLLIWNNYFYGSLPPGLGKNSKLTYVDVSTNKFTGSIPPSICAGGVLLKLILFSNNFTGSLSPSLSNCSSLVRLRVEDNSFSGVIPLKFSLLPDITYVDLSRNKFIGGIPSDISKAVRLQYFNISKNPALGGIIPEKTWFLPHLQNFSASSCNISGNLPAFRYCKSISIIELSMNDVSGSVPESISNCQVLKRIDLAKNKLAGQIPEVLASLPALHVLDLSNNNLIGTIPTKFSHSSSLLLINVSFNDISGTIPYGEVLRQMDSSAFAGNSKLCGAPLRPCLDSTAMVVKKGMGKLTWVLLLCAVAVVIVLLLALGALYFQRGSRGQWKMIPFTGLPQFTANDLSRSFSSVESIASVPSTSASVCKVVLPTGTTVSVKKIEWEANRMKVMSEFIIRMGNARHMNLIRLLGFYYDNHLAYLLYDYFPNGYLDEIISMQRDWTAKYKIVIGIARGLRFLHHDCYPAIPHGDLKSDNIVFDEDMEPHLTGFGLKYLAQLSKGSLPPTVLSRETGQFNNSLKEELYMDIYSFGEVVLEILTNGRLRNAGEGTQSKPKEVLLKEIYDENEVGHTGSLQEEIKLVLEVAMLCTRSRPSDRPSMEDALKLLSGLLSGRI